MAPSLVSGTEVRPPREQAPPNYECWGFSPVLDVSLDPPVNETAFHAGPLSLPLSPERPDILTAARIGFSWSRRESEEPRTLHVSIDFPDPKPFGIPYTIQGFTIESASSSFFEDWTNACEGAGISIFPGGSWDGDLEAGPGQTLPGDESRLRIRVWGSRN